MRSPPIDPETARLLAEAAREQRKALEALRRHFRPPEDPTGVMGFREFQQQGAVAQAYREFLDPPMLRTAREVAKSMLGSGGYQEALRSATLGLGTVGEAERKALRSAFTGGLGGAAGEAYRASVGSAFTGLGTIGEAQKEALRSLGDTFSGVQEMMRQAAAPLAEFAATIQAQREQQAALIARHMSGIDWTELQEAATALRRSYVFDAQAGALALNPGEAAFEIIKSLDAAAPVTPSAVAAVLSLIAAALQRVGRNTKREVGEAGLLTLLAFFVLFSDILEKMDPSPAEVPAVAETRQLVGDVKRQLESAAEAEAAELAILAAAPRALVLRPARIREAASRRSVIIDRLPAETVVAVLERRERWRRIAFRDSLSGALREGWTYGPLLGEP